MMKHKGIVVVLRFYIPPTAKVIWGRDLGLKSLLSSERLEKPGIEPTTPGLQGEWLNHYATEASTRALKTLTKELHCFNFIFFEILHIIKYILKQISQIKHLNI